jgi:hypothetical protein
MSTESNVTPGWVIVNVDGWIMTWSFDYTRKQAIAHLVKDSGQTWKQWYRQGARCVKATKIISINT